MRQMNSKAVVKAVASLAMATWSPVVLAVGNRPPLTEPAAHFSSGWRWGWIVIAALLVILVLTGINNRRFTRRPPSNV